MRYAIMERDGFCRGCDKSLKKNIDMAIKFWSNRNRGQHIIVCKECVNKMIEIIDNAQ